MVARIVATGVLLFLAGGAFLGAAPVPASPLNPFGILLLTIAGVIWFAWDVIREGFSYGAGSGQDGAQVPLLARFGPVFIKGITSGWRPAHRAGEVRKRTASENPSAQPSAACRGGNGRALS